MFKTLDVEIKGVAPLMLCSGRLANPMDEHAKAIRDLKAIPNKQKTDETWEDIFKHQWYACMYHNDKGNPVVPGQNIEAGLYAAGKKKRLGVVFKSGVFCHDMPEIRFQGPKTVDALWDDGGFSDNRLVCTNPSSSAKTRAMFCRPIFRDWSLKFEITYGDINVSEIHEALETLGAIIGLCSYRPQFGRFEVVS